MAISHLYPNIRPSLDLNFAATKRLDPRITFSRSSSGTYFDANGVLQSAATNVARFDHNPSTGESLGLLVEEARTNYATYSENLTSSAFTASGASLYPNSTLSLNGLFNAYKIAENTANSSHYIGVSFGSGSGSTYVFSFFVKASGRTSIYVEPDPGNFTGSGGWIFDLSAGTYSGGRYEQQQVAINSVGGGWYKCICSSKASINGTNSFRIYLYSGSSTYTGDGSSGVQICCPQIEIGNFATSYIPTPATFTSRASSATYYDANGVIQTASTNVSRSAAFFPDSNGVMRPAGLLLEAAGTNLLQYSEQLNTSPWTLNNSASVSANSSVAPDGQTTADTLSGAATNSYAEQTISWSASGNWTLSFFAKAGTSVRNKIYIVRSDSQVHGTNIDWSSGVPSFSTTFGCTAQSEKIGNGWYRISLLLASVDHTATNFLRITSDFISGTGTVLLWGFQAEQNPYPTSYIPTTTATVTRSADVSSSATVTRSADVAQITGTNFSSWWNATSSTYYASVFSRASNQDNRAILGIAGSSTERQVTFNLDSNSVLIGTRLDNTFYGSSVSMSPLGTSIRAAGAITASGVNLSVNGTLGSAGSPTRLATSVPTQMDVGRFLADSQYSLNGTLSRLTYWPTRLPDATLQSITR